MQDVKVVWAQTGDVNSLDQASSQITQSTQH